MWTRHEQKFGTSLGHILQYRREMPIDRGLDVNNRFDVVVVGMGLAGLAAGIHLSRAGLRVAAIENAGFPHARVGESLDWSSPILLKNLGLSRELLIKEGVATWKRKIRVEPLGEHPFGAQPDEYEFLSKKPLEFEVLTLHVDRTELDQRLFAMAEALGVTFVWDRVATLESQRQRVLACQTECHGRIAAPWFIDSTGRAGLFAKALGIPRTEFGRPKVCLWTYFNGRCDCEGTTFFTDGGAEYLWWIWEIPIRPDKVSVGLVVPAEQIRARFQTGQRLNEIFRNDLAKFPRFHQRLVEQPDFQVSTCSWRNYVHRQVCGENWLMAGESASLPDPLTANGVTAALRHAQEASEFILESASRRSLSLWQRYVYKTNVCRMGRIYNFGIEKIIYDSPLRRGVGTALALRVYAHFGYSMNALYSKFQPRRPVAIIMFGFLMGALRAWMEVWSMIGKLVVQAKRFGRMRLPA